MRHDAGFRHSSAKYNKQLSNCTDQEAYVAGTNRLILDRTLERSCNFCTHFLERFRRKNADLHPVPSPRSIDI